MLSETHAYNGEGIRGGLAHTAHTIILSRSRMYLVDHRLVQKVLILDRVDERAVIGLDTGHPGTHALHLDIVRRGGSIGSSTVILNLPGSCDVMKLCCEMSNE